MRNNDASSGLGWRIQLAYRRNISKIKSGRFCSKHSKALQLLRLTASPSKTTPAEKTRPSSQKGIIIKDLVANIKATELLVPEGKGKVPMKAATQPPVLSSSSSSLH